jgi:hypothetical protein
MPQDSTKKGFRLFALLAVLVILSAVGLDVFLTQSIVRDRASAVAMEREVGSLQVALADMRGAQAAYLATGQGPDFWIQKSSDLSARLEAGLTRLRESAATPELRTGYQAALGMLGNLMSLDKKARDYVHQDQRFLAADVVFLESVDTAQRLAGDLDRLRSTQTAQAESLAERLNWIRLGTTAAAMAVVLLVALRVGRPAPLPAASEAALTAQMIRDLPPPVKSATPPPARPAPAVAAPPTPPPPAPVVNLPEAAELCVDLARVMDSRDVPALLERVAKVLDAKGLVVWMVDSARGVLHPSLAHGYPDKVLTRLGTLGVDDDNVTSLAFRSVRPQVMAGSPGASAAVAVPLVTAAGCSGVLAAELRESKPAPELLALARIVAAQFATLIAPAEFSSARAAEA